MEKWYHELYFNRRDWIMMNIAKRKLTCTEAIIILMIEFLNEHNQDVSIQTLSTETNISQADVDQAIARLNKKGYLTIITKNHKVVFNIDGLFEGPVESDYTTDVFATFEKEFGRLLTQPETTCIAEWLQRTDAKTVIWALREAMINKKPNINYIGKIIANKLEENNHEKS